MLANKIEERANGYLICAVSFRKAAKQPIRFDIAVSGMETADSMKQLSTEIPEGVMQRIAYPQPICITCGNIYLFLLDYLDT